MRTSKKKTRVYWLANVFPSIVLAMALLQFFLPDKMRPEMWIGVVGSLVATYFGLLKQWIDHDKMFKDLFIEFNTRFDGMN